MSKVKGRLALDRRQGEPIANEQHAISLRISAVDVGTVIMKHPFALPTHLSPDLARVEAYWRGLLRGGAKIPFWDDAKLTDLPDLMDRLFLVDVFQRPERFRFGLVGNGVGGEALSGLFLDEAALPAPFAFLRSQCAAAVEAAEPTLMTYGDPPGLARLVLPMWGEGSVSMLLGAVDFGS